MTITATGSRLLSADDQRAEKRGPKVLIVGPPGVGKTSLLRTLDSTTLGRTLFIDLEAGDLAVADLAVASIRPQTWPDLRDVACALGGPDPAVAPGASYSQTHFDKVIANEELARLAEFEILFVDSLSEASRRCLTWAQQQPESFTERGKKDLRGTYGLLGREMVPWLQRLQHMRARTVILVAVLEKAVDDFNVATWRPQIEGQRTANVLPAIVDEVTSMHFVDFGDGKAVRAFVCGPNALNLPGKDRSGKLMTFEEPNLGKLLVKLTTPKPTETEGD